MAKMDGSTIHVEVAYARAHEQKIIAMKVKEGTTVLNAARESGIIDCFPEINLDEARLGIFGKTVLRPGEEVLREGDRVEVYRPLIADPKEVRKRRAEQAKQKTSR